MLPRMAVLTKHPLARCAVTVLAAALPGLAGAVDVRICTDRGALELTLDEQSAPRLTGQFVRLVRDGFYSGTVFHRVVPGTLVEGGAYTGNLEPRTPAEPVPGDNASGLANLRGTIATARSGSPDSSAQFIINLADNANLDPAPGSGGYVVFGRVTAGLDLLDAIAAQPTRRAGNLTDVPLSPIELQSVTTVNRNAVFGLSVEPDPARLRQDFEAAMTREDASSIIAAIDGLRGACQALNSRQYLAEAEAAIELNRPQRAQSALQQAVQSIAGNDPLLPRLQRLYAGLPQSGRSNVEDRLTQCRRPAVPPLPAGRSADAAALRVVESQLRNFQRNGEQYLRCVAQVIDGGTLDDLQARDATALYNAVVIELTATTVRYNTLVQNLTGARY